MEKIPFYTRDNRPKATPSATGDGYEKEYGVALEENGHKILKEIGKTHAYAMIQTYAEECKIENILKRSILDPSVLERKMAMYDDFTDAPKTLMEAQNLMVSAENIWNTLTAAEREEFNGEFSQFIAAYGSEKWLRVMGFTNDDTEYTEQEDLPISEEKGGEE